MSKTKIKDTNITINGIEQRAVNLLNELRLTKRKAMFDKEIKANLYEYVYGSGENPFSELNDSYEVKIIALREKVQNTAEIEKKNYLGKKKRGINFVKKLSAVQMK